MHDTETREHPNLRNYLVASVILLLQDSTLPLAKCHKYGDSCFPSPLSVLLLYSVLSYMCVFLNFHFAWFERYKNVLFPSFIPCMILNVSPECL